MPDIQSDWQAGMVQHENIELEAVVEICKDVVETALSLRARPGEQQSVKV